MKVKRSLSLAIGLLASILGLSVAVDTALADGCCCCCSSNDCPNQTFASCGTKACLTPGPNTFVCGATSDPGTCTSKNVEYVEVLDFPRGSCGTYQYGTVCNQPLSNCSRNTTCKMKNGVCMPDQGATIWSSQPKVTTVYCPT